MSVITFPRRVDSRPLPGVVRPTTRPRTDAVPRRARRAEVATRRAGLLWRGRSAAHRSSVLVIAALVCSLAGTLVVANRQIEIHRLQTQLLQIQSSYAQQVGSLTTKAAPSQIAEQAGALHLVSPSTVTQVPSTSLDAPLPLPKFSGYAPVTSRTNR